MERRNRIFIRLGVQNAHRTLRMTLPILPVFLALLPAAATEPGLLDVAVGHAGDVVGDGAGQALGGDLRLVVGGELGGVGDEGGEEALHNFGGVGVGFFHSG